MTSKKIFCVIVTYNGSKWVDKCFGSLRQADHPVQTVVIDNGSTDDTVEAITSRFPEVNVIRSAENLGFGRGNNEGIKMVLAQGADYVILLNQDAHLWNGSLKNLLELMEATADAGIVSPLHFAGDQKNLDKGFRRYMDPALTPGLLKAIAAGQPHAFYESKFVNAAAWVVNGKIFGKIGLFDPIFDHYGEDNEYVIRMQRAGYKMYVYPGLSIVHDRPQARTGSFFEQGESFKRKQLVDVVTGQRSLASVNWLYCKVVLHRLFRFKLGEAMVSVRNWMWLNKKMRHRTKGTA